MKKSVRYNQLLPIIAHTKPRTIVEVGTWNGLRAIMMAEEALKHQDQVHYIGFDLFEDATEETDTRELNVKKHHNCASVSARLQEFQDRKPGFTFELHKGDTRQTLKDFAPVGDAMLAFIDGGHSVETIRNDYEALMGADTIVFDDYYTEGPDTEKYGCNSLVQGLEDRMVLPQKDPVAGGGKVQMVVTPMSAWPGKANIVVKTKNSVPNENIHANIRYNMTLHDRWIPECDRHGLTAVLVSGGPSFSEHLAEIKKERRRKTCRIICVKHSHDRLISEGIIPWACMLLDPRDHVRDFVENPHPKVNYFVASMCHPTVIDRMKKAGAKVWGYHAHVGAGEEKIIGQFGKHHILLGGGSTSAVRGISVLYTIGFRKFRLYGYDSCYENRDAANGKDQVMEVEVAGRKFVTDAELIAQAQDFEKVMSDQRDLDLEVIGDGMIPHFWQARRKVRPSFEDVFSG